MTRRKTQETDASVSDFLNSIANETMREDSFVVANIMESISGKKSKMWGTSIVGAGKRYYTYANGQIGEICKIGFSPRAKSLVFYLTDFKGKVKLIKKLGKHKMSGSCLHIKKLADVNVDVLEDIIERVYLHKSESLSE